MPKFEMPAELLQALHDYLLSRPMREVEGLVVQMRACKRIEAVEPAVPPEVNHVN